MRINVEYGDQTYRFLFPLNLSPIVRKARTFLIGFGIALFIGLYFIMVRPVLRPGAAWVERVFFVVIWLVASGVFILAGWGMGHARTIVTWDARQQVLTFAERMGPMMSRQKVFLVDQIERIHVEPLLTRDGASDLLSGPGKLVIDRRDNGNREELLVGFPMGILQEFAAQIRSYTGLDKEDASGWREESDARLRMEACLKRLDDLTPASSGITVRRESDGWSIHIKPIGLRGIGWIFMIGPIVGVALAVILSIMMLTVHAKGVVWLIPSGVWALVGGFSALALHQLTKSLTIRYRDRVLSIENESRLARRFFRIEANEIQRVERYIAMLVNKRPVYGIRLTVSGRKRRIKLFHFKFHRNDPLVKQLCRLFENVSFSG